MPIGSTSYLYIGLPKYGNTPQNSLGSKSSMYTGTSPSCKDVPERMGNKAYSYTSCSGLSGGGGEFLYLKVGLPLPHLLPPL